MEPGVEIEETRGTRGKVIIGERTITKEFFRPEDPSNQAQIKIIRKCLEYQEKHNGHPPKGFPKVIRLLTNDNGQIVGYEQEGIMAPNLRDYLNQRGKLSPEQAEELFITLVELQKVFGQPHGDLGEGGFITCQNILVEEGESGLKFYFIDYGGTADYEGRNQKEAEELIKSERSMLLQALFIPSSYSGKSKYVDADRETLLESHQKLEEKYL